MSRMDSVENITLNIGGFPFKISKDAICRLPNFKAMSNQTEYPFDRPRQCFEAIYNYCVLGKLHIPPNVCTGEFLEELEFWGVKAEKLEKCCHHRYVLFMREQENLRGFIKCTEKEDGQNEAAEKFQTNGAKSRLWNILDNRDSKLETKVCSGYLEPQCILVFYKDL